MNMGISFALMKSPAANYVGRGIPELPAPIVSFVMRYPEAAEEFRKFSPQEIVRDLHPAAASDPAGDTTIPNDPTAPRVSQLGGHQLRHLLPARVSARQFRDLDGAHSAHVAPCDDVCRTNVQRPHFRRCVGYLIPPGAGIPGLDHRGCPIAHDPRAGRRDLRGPGHDRVFLCRLQPGAARARTPRQPPLSD